MWEAHSRRAARGAVIALAALVAGAEGCGSTQVRPAKTATAGPPAQRAESRERPVSAPMRSEVPATIRDFESTAAKLPDRPGRLAHTAVISAMRSMAAALEALPAKSGGVSEAARAIEADADKLERSPERSLEHADIARHALDRALGALESVAGAVSSGVAAKIDAARSSIARINVTRPLLPQRSRVDAAFQAVAEAVTAAASLPRSPAQRTVLPSSAELETLRRLTAKLSTARGDEAARTRVALLRGLADAFDGLELRAASMDKAIATIRREAQKLEDMSSLTWERSSHLRAALTAAVRALAEAWDQLGGRAAREWVTAARSAVESIEKDSFIDFQLPQVQDAFRSIVDAVAAVREQARCG